MLCQNKKHRMAVKKTSNYYPQLSSACCMIHELRAPPSDLGRQVGTFKKHFVFNFVVFCVWMNIASYFICLLNQLVTAKCPTFKFCKFFVQCIVLIVIVILYRVITQHEKINYLALIQLAISQLYCIPSQLVQSGKFLHCIVFLSK